MTSNLTGIAPGGLSYAIVDVFTREALSGNPLAVVTGADGLSAARMAAIAQEFNLSETTFISRPTMAGASWRLRSFTPGGEEVHGAGHNSLGAWWWLRVTNAVVPGTAHQELGGLVLPVQLSDEASPLVTLEQGRPQFTIPTVARGDLLSALGLPADAEVGDLVVGSVGSPHLLVSLSAAEVVDAADPDRAALRSLLAGIGAEGCYVYSAGEGEADAYARFFNPTVGIVEDPATGTAAGPLAGHLYARDVAGPTVVIEQGVRMGRRCLLRVDIDGSGTRLSGRCALAATGTLHA